MQKIGKMFTTFILFFSLYSNLYAGPCADWTLLLPPARDAASMAFDSTRNQTILFGGFSNGQSLNDTWSWDGTKWTQHFPETSPPGRQFGAMAFDPSTNQIVLFGGAGNSGNLGDTWTWDGTNWTEQLPVSSPSARTGASMAFDSINNLLILFGGFSGSTSMNDTWNWNGSNWVQLLDGSTNSPPARSFATMAFGPTVNQMILFGGFGTVTRINDTWSWDGATTTWTELNDGSSGAPPARSNAVMGYDPVNDLNILFGGQSNSGDLGDTWSWDGTTWSVPASITTSPSARDSASMALDANNNLILFGGINGQIFGDTWSWGGTDWMILVNPPTGRSFASMAFDSSSNQLILFGGFGTFGGIFNDTFNWDGIAWTELFPSTSPAERGSASMAFDSATLQLILFGGFGNSGVLDDTWNWDGTDWVQLSPATSPPARSDASMAFNNATNQLILFGGFSFSGTLNDTWNWDGTTWSQLFPSTSPSVRSDASMAFDAATNQLILFGGNGETGQLNDTWSWDGTNWVQLFPATSPPARADAVMAFDPGTNQLLLFGGSGDNGDLTDTWSWDGTTWEQLFPSNFPIFPDGNAMAFDSATDQMVLFDGVGNTWNWASFPAFFAMATPSSQSICSGQTTSIALSANVPGATFSWTASSNGVSGASDGSGPLIAQTLSITSTSAGSVTYTITPTSPTGCQGSPISVIVTVNLLPFAAATPPSQTLLTGETTSIAISSNVPGTTFSWTAFASGVSGASNGSGSLIAQTLLLTTSAPGTVTYTITPTSLTGCPGSTLIAVVTVESFIPPPSDFRGKIRKDKFLTQTDIINQLSWKPSTDPSVVGYLIRGSDGSVAKVPASGPFKVDFHNRRPHQTYIYTVVAFTNSGQESSPLTVSLRDN